MGEQSSISLCVLDSYFSKNCDRIQWLLWIDGRLNFQSKRVDLVTVPALFLDICVSRGQSLDCFCAELPLLSQPLQLLETLPERLPSPVEKHTPTDAKKRIHDAREIVLEMKQIDDYHLLIQDYH